MPYKKKAVVKKVYKKRAPKVASKTALAVRAIVKKELKKVQEIKKSNRSNTDGVECGHNSFVALDSTLLQTTQGITDPADSYINNRIG